MGDVQLPPSRFVRRLEDAQSEVRKAKFQIAQVESQILDTHKDLQAKDMNPETIAAKASEFLTDYTNAAARRDNAIAARDAVAGTTTYTTGPQTPRTLGPSAIFPNLKGVGRSTRKRRSRKQWTSSATRRRSWRSASRTRRAASSTTSSARSTSTRRKSASVRAS